MTFKVGDKVVCVRKDVGQYIVVGAVYTVAEFWNGEFVRLEEIKPRHSYFSDKFKLAQQEEWTDDICLPQ